MIAHAGVERREVEGRRAAELAAQVELDAAWPRPARTGCYLPRPGAAPSQIERGADLPAPHVVESLGRMKAPLSPSVLTGGRVLRVRDRMKLLEVVKRGRSHDVSLGVSEIGGQAAIPFHPDRNARRKRRSA